MKRARLIIRVTFLLLAIFLLVDMNRKTNEQEESVTEFKIKTFNKIQADTLGTKHQMDQVLKDTTKFIDSSSRVRNGIHYLEGLLGLFVVFELGFYILKKRNLKVEI